MAQNFLVTNGGLAAASIASPTGPWVNVTSFKVGTGVNYTPVVTDTALHGTTLHTGTPFSYSIVDSNTVDILLVMDVDVGPFQFGEVGLFLADGTLFALMTYTNLQDKLKAIGTQLGTRWAIHALVRLIQAPAIMQINVTNVAGLLEVPDWASLVAPQNQLSQANACIIHEATPNGSHPIVVKNAPLDWTIYKYRKYATGNISSATTTTFTSTVFSSVAIDAAFPSKQYIAKFLSTGLIRSLASVAGNIATINGNMPVPSGSVEIWIADDDADRISGVRVCSGNEYIALANKINTWWATPTSFATGIPGNSGWGQTGLPIVTQVPSDAQWATLMNAVISGATLTGVDSTGLSASENFVVKPSDSSMKAVMAKRETYDLLHKVIDNIAGNKNSNGHELIAIETNNPVAGTRTRSGTDWATPSNTHLVTVTFGTENDMLAWFNAGGYIAFSASVTNPFNAEQTSWQTKLASIGTTRYNYAETVNANGVGTVTPNKGFYASTGAFVLIYTHLSNTDLTYSIEVKKTSVTVLDFRITFDNTSGYVGGATGTSVISSVTTLGRPSSAVLTTPVFNYPGVSSAGTL